MIFFLPMLIKRIEVENFRSFFAKQGINVGIKNIIIGKNGSGKSNLLSAICNLFLYDEEKRPQHNGNEETSFIEVEVDNSSKRLLLPANFVLKATIKNNAEFTINDKSISREELKGLFENAGFTQECFVMQGKVNDIALMNSKERFRMIARIAGVEKYEDSKAMALNLLNEESEEKIEALIEKIEMKMKISEEYKRKAEEYEFLSRAKADAEFELLNYELKELNEEIDGLETGLTMKTAEKDEGMLEFEISACKAKMDRLRIEMHNAEEFIRGFDPAIVNSIKERLGRNGSMPADVNPYDHKVTILGKAKAEAFQKLQQAETSEKERYVELKALKFLEAIPAKGGNIELLEKQLAVKREEIRNFKDGKQTKEEYKSLLFERKQFWIREKQIKDELKALQDLEKSSENKILYLGKLSINIYETLKNHEGVIGTVFSLFDIPDHLLDSFEAITKNSLFWIVVENDEVATKLVNNIEGRVTFVALNRVKPSSWPKVRTDQVYRLSEHIKCDPKFKNLLEMVCRDYYVSKDCNAALSLSEKYNINVVTLDGDIFNKNGSITGGYENTSQALKELKNHRRRIAELEKELKTTETTLSMLNEKIKYAELGCEDESRALENLQAIERYLVLNIELLRHGKISVPDLVEMEAEHARIQESLPRLKLALETLDGQLSRASEKKMKIDEVVEKIKMIEESAISIENLKASERALVDSLYVIKANENLEESGRFQKKHLLIDKRTHLMKKIGISDFRSIFLKRSKEELVFTLKDINRKLKGYAGFSKKEILDDQRQEMCRRLEELRISKSKILEFIAVLDQNKEDTFNLSFSMISENYSYFFKKFTGKLSTLHLRNEAIDVMLDGKPCDLPSMSGGQKTVIALSIIFAIQKNDPSPFYVFDEIDANLDFEHCQRLTEIIKGSDAQYFICSFKPELLGAGDRFYGVVSRDKQSFVDEIAKELAYETIEPVY